MNMNEYSLFLVDNFTLYFMSENVYNALDNYLKL